MVSAIVCCVHSVWSIDRPFIVLTETKLSQHAGFVDENQLSGGQSAEMASAAVSSTKTRARGESRVAPS